jgi:hypothetical protein
MRAACFSLALAILAACNENPQGPARSPSVDYPPPPVQTSDGQVVGADRTPPGDHIQQSPRVGTQGLQPAATPPAASSEQPRPGPVADPCKQPLPPPGCPK